MSECKIYMMEMKDIQIMKQSFAKYLADEHYFVS